MRILGALAVVVMVGCNSGGATDGGAGGGGGSGGSGGWAVASGVDPHGEVVASATVGNRLFIAVTGVGVSSSADGDATWSATNTGLASTVNVFHLLANGTDLLMGADDVYRSADTGATWTSLHSVATGINIVTVAQFNQAIFAGPAPTGLLASSDDGATWTPNSFSNGFVVTIAQKGSSLYLGGSLGLTVSKSSDNGVTWADSSNGMPAMESVQALAVSGTTLLAAGAHGVYRSTDDGASWSASTTGIPTGSIQTLALLVNGSRVYLGTEDGVFVSTNDGMSWSAISGLDSPARVQTMTVFGGKLYVGLYSKGLWHHAL